MVVAFVAIGMTVVMACAGPARGADAAAGAFAVAQATDARHDYTKELKLLRPLAEQGDATAQSRLGSMYYFGRGVPKNYTEAARWFRKAAEQGGASVQFLLGLMYNMGQGVPKDYAEAARWFRKAAEQGVADAQVHLGAMFSRGWGVPKNSAEAVRWYRMAAEQGNAVGQGFLGLCYEGGEGVPRDYVQAYMWLNIAAAGGDKLAAQNRDRVEHSMTVQQIAEAQRRTAAWQPKHSGEQPAASSASTAKQEPAPGQLGTGFFVGDGMVVTNAHVVKGCSEVSIGPPERRVTARVIARDGDNDLALLRAATYPTAVAVLRLSVRQGEAVTAYGYPLPGLLSSGGNLTTGNITALSGIGDDSRFLQISAPVQPGNSGGPLLDGGGNVVGIVEGKLNAIKVATAIGDVPQNVNFAIKASVMATFLDSNGVNYRTGQLGAGRSPADIGEDARRFTVPVECRASAQ
jgi:S1-C subfamily serine protease